MADTEQYKPVSLVHILLQKDESSQSQLQKELIAQQKL